ncbi:MAG: DUF2924 domain-containing protein [Candidatus Methanoperedens sp.]
MNKIESMTKIDIDNEVWKELQKKAIPFEDTPNSVLRKLLGLEDTNKKNSTMKPDTEISNISEPFKLPTLISTAQVEPPNIIGLLEGKRLWKKFKGKDCFADVKNGKFIIDGKAFDSPSSAAMHITGTFVNGWMFWKYNDSNSNRWLPIDKLR